MKKQYKFKAWNGEELSEECNVFLDKCFVFKNSENVFVNDAEMAGLKVIECTDKKDSKDNYIWEGSIIEFNRREWGGNDNIHVVEWDEDNSEWCWGGGSTSDMEWRTVVGNIYENPELLK